MLKRLKLYGLTLAASAALAACAPAQTPEAMMAETPTAMTDTMKPESGDAMMAQTPDAMTAQDAMTDTMMAKTPDAMMAQDAMTDTMMAETPDAMMAQDTMTDTMMAATPDAMMAMPGWFSAPLTEATSGATFTIQDFKGKVVLVETMAIWCSTCLSQQKEVKALHALLGERDDFVSVGIDVDINENLAGLKAYVAKNSFDWTYTVAAPDVAREIGNLYGAQFLNPPSAPMFIIDRHGEVQPLPFGVKSAADLQKALEPFLNDAM